MVKKYENIGGTTLDTMYDRRYKCVDLELVQVHLGEESYFEIHIDATTEKGKFKHLLKLHIKEAIELKSIIDNLVYDALTE